MNYVQLSFVIPAGEARDRLIAALSSAGSEAFEENDEALNAFFPAHQFNPAAVNSAIAGFNISYVPVMIPEQNWNAAWESSFEPVTVPGFCTIRADFHSPDTSVEHEIIITPKMSFGTGHHATTRLMIQAMRGLPFEQRSVLDFGTGTGILAILASRLKAEKVVAINNDAWSVENAAENIQGNHTAGVEIRSGSLEVVAEERFDIILANINRHILLGYMAEMRSLLNPGGILVLSGILTDDEVIITAAARENDFIKVSGTEENNWICLVFSI